MGILTVMYLETSNVDSFTENRASIFVRLVGAGSSAGRAAPVCTATVTATIRRFEPLPPVTFHKFHVYSYLKRSSTTFALDLQSLNDEALRL